MCTPGSTCDFTTGAVAGVDLSDEQKQLLLELIANSGMADEQTPADALKITATLHDTVIAWSEETTYDMSTGNGISFSICGPTV